MADGDIHTIRVGPRTFSYEEGTEADDAPYYQSDIKLSKGIVDANGVAIETVFAIPVADIDDPAAELVGYAGRAAGALLVAYEVGAATDVFTLYAWDAADTGGANSPYVVAGSSGFWVAIGGRYSCADVTFAGAAVFGAGATFNTDITVKGAEGASGVINLNADEGDDNVDKWRLVAADGGAKFTVETYASGAWVAVFTVDASNDITVANDLKLITTDSDKVILGAGSDASLYYDGADLNIKANDVAASDLKIHTGAAKTLELQTVVWEDLRFPAHNTKVNPSKSEPAYEAFINGVFAYHFDPANADDESLHFIAQLPHTYKEETDIYPHVHWSPKTTDTGNVLWELSYTWQNQDAGAFPATTQITIPQAGGGVALAHQLISFDPISGSGKTISSILLCRLTRLGTDEADTFTGDAAVLEVDIHYQLNTMGSRQELIK